MLRRHFFVREAEADGAVQVLPIDTTDNLSDLLTKCIEGAKCSAVLSRILRQLV